MDCVTVSHIIMHPSCMYEVISYMTSGKLWWRTVSVGAPSLHITSCSKWWFPELFTWTYGFHEKSLCHAHIWKYSALWLYYVSAWFLPFLFYCDGLNTKCIKKNYTIVPAGNIMAQNYVVYILCAHSWDWKIFQREITRGQMFLPWFCIFSVD